MSSTRFFQTDLRRSMRSSWIAMAVLTLSFLGPVISSMLRSSVEDFLTSNSRRILTADLAITAYRPIREDEVDRLREKYGIKKEVREIEFVTMAVSQSGQGTMVEIHAVEEEFPIEGEFLFDDGSKSPKGPSAENIWLSNDAAVALGLKLGDRLRLGKIEFAVDKIVAQSPGVSRAAFGFAPRAYIPLARASLTGLLGFGSQIYHRVYLETSVVAPTEEVKEALGDPDLFLRTPDDSIQGLERFTGFISLYLAVVSVSLFTLGWAAAFYIIRTQSIERMRSSAIALVFGGSQKSILRYEFSRTAFLTLASAMLAFALARIGAQLLEPMISQALSKNVPGEFTVSVSFSDVFGLAITAVVSAVLFTLPFATRLRSSQLRELFDDSPLSVPTDSIKGRPLAFLVGGMAILTLAAMASWMTRDWKRGLQLTAGFVVAAGVIHWVGIGFFGALSRSFRHARGKAGSLFRLVGVQLSRARFAVRLSFLAIGLSTFVASAVGQIMVSLSDELGSGGRLDSAPDFFLFNIPESELENLQSTVAAYGVQLDFLSPMILARFQTKNGNTVESEQFRKFPVRITWREKQISSEKITSGQPLPPTYDPASSKLPKISIESRFAERNGLDIGDTLGFDVQGVPVEGEIGNIRSVRWTDFNPNFFISFQGGVLEDAPKTWLANVRTRTRDDRPKLQAEIVRKFPDLSIIDVSQTLEKIVALMRAILGPAEIAAWLTSLFSILVLLTIVTHSTRLRAHEMNLFRILGAEPRRVRQLYRFEFALAAGLGSLVGVLGGVGLAAYVSKSFLDLEYRFDGVRFFVTLIVGFGLGTAMGDWLYSRVSRGLGFNRRVV